jgi:hypothetical protein
MKENDDVKELKEMLCAFVEQYNRDMRGDTNADNGGRRGMVENIRELRSNQKQLETKVREIKEMEDQVKKNTRFRQNAQKAGWIIITIILTVVVSAAVYNVALWVINQ